MDELKEVHYDAFISYRHSDVDSFVASNLHKKLENFRLPASVKKKMKTDREKINRVFRDVDELPLSENLSEPINKALANSDYLITICTPRYQESLWCMKEIEVFLQTHSRDHILVVLAEGEPADVFPDVLTHESVEITDADGTVHTETRELEPLAADTRGSSKKEILKAMDIATIKLCAAIFGLNYDDLKQRHREAKMRKLMLLLGIIGAVGIAFALVVTGMLVKISRQSSLIAEQYDALNDEYASQAVGLAENLLGEGKRKDAVKTLLTFLPEKEKDGYKAEALACLYKAMNVYNVDSDYFPAVNYPAEHQLFGIDNFDISPNGKKIMLADGFNIFVYDVESGELLEKVDNNPASEEYSLSAKFCGMDNFLVTDGMEVRLYTEDREEPLVLGTITPKSHFYASDDGEVTLALYEDTITGIDGNGVILYQVKIDGEFDLMAGQVYFFDGIIVINDDKEYVLMDEKTGKILARTDESSFGVGDDSTSYGCYLRDHILYRPSVNLYSESADTMFAVSAYDFDNKRTLWVKRFPDQYYDMIRMCGDHLYLFGYAGVLVLDSGTGRELMNYRMSAPAVCAWAEEDYMYCIDENGMAYQFDDENFYALEDFFTVRPTQKIDSARYVGGKIFCNFLETNYVTAYIPGPVENAEHLENPAWHDYSVKDATEEAALIPDVNMAMTENIFYSADEKYIVVGYLNHSVEIYSAETQKKVAQITSQDTVFAMHYSEKRGCYIIDTECSSIILNPGFEVICRLDFIESESGDDLILQSRDYESWRVPYVGYEDLIKMAEEYAGEGHN